MPKCKSCGAEIIWTQNIKTGKKIPFDAESLGKAWMIAKNRFGGMDCSYRETYEPHWSTCPDADKFKGKGHEYKKTRRI